MNFMHYSIILVLLLLSSTATVSAAPLPKVPTKGQSAVQFAERATTEQIAAAYNEAVKSLLPGLAASDDAILNALEATIHTATRPGAETERLACCNALVASLNAADTSPRVKACLLRQLQNIGKEESVPALIKLLTDADLHVAGYARSALINNPACPEQFRKQFAAEALAIDQKDSAIVGDRELQQAWQLLNAGKRSEAAATFAKLTTSNQHRQVRFAALRGTLAAAGDAAVPQMLTLLAGDDADSRIVALGWIKELSPQTRATFAAGCSQLPSAIQAIVLESLAGLGEKAAVPLALRGLQSSDPLLQSAALTALGNLGQVGGDEAVIAAMEASAGATKISLIDVLLKRGSQTAVPALLTVAEGTDAACSKAACKALAELVTEADAPKLLARLADPKLVCRTDIEAVAIKALARVTPSEQRMVLVEAKLGSPASFDVRSSALRMYRYCSDAKALAAVKEAMADKEPKVREAAVRVLFDWSDCGAWDVILAVFEKPEKPAFGVLAWRSLLRLAQNANKEPDDALVARYGQLLTLARNDADRSTVIGALGACGHVGALELAVQQLAVPNLRADTEAAVKSIAELIRKKHPKEVKDALKKLQAK
jgi:HEAT repeat protein